MSKIANPCPPALADRILSLLQNDSGTARLSIRMAKKRSPLVTVKPAAKLKTCTSTGQILLGFTECSCQACKPRRKVAAR